MSRARRVAALFRRAELLQVEVADAGLVQPGRELALGETGPPRGCHRAGIDEEADAGKFELGDNGLRFRLLVADREQSRLHVRRAINSIAAAGARTFPSWIT